MTPETPTPDTPTVQTESRAWQAAEVEQLRTNAADTLELLNEHASARAELEEICQGLRAQIAQQANENVRLKTTIASLLVATADTWEAAVAEARAHVTPEKP